MANSKMEHDNINREPAKIKGIQSFNINGKTRLEDLTEGELDVLLNTLLFKAGDTVETSVYVTFKFLVTQMQELCREINRIKPLFETVSNRSTEDKVLTAWKESELNATKFRPEEVFNNGNLPNFYKEASELIKQSAEGNKKYKVSFDCYIPDDEPVNKACDNITGIINKYFCYIKPQNIRVTTDGYTVSTVNFNNNIDAMIDNSNKIIPEIKLPNLISEKEMHVDNQLSCANCKKPFTRSHPADKCTCFTTTVEKFEDACCPECQTEFRQQREKNLREFFPEEDQEEFRKMADDLADQLGISYRLDIIMPILQKVAKYGYDKCDREWIDEGHSADCEIRVKIGDLD